MSTLGRTRRIAHWLATLLSFRIDFILNAPFLSNADKEAILGGNMIKMLRIAS